MVFKNLRQFHRLHTKTGLCELVDVAKPSGMWLTSRSLCCRYSQQDYIDLPEEITPIFTGALWTYGRTNIAGISLFGEVFRHQGLTNFIPALQFLKAPIL